MPRFSIFLINVNVGEAVIDSSVIGICILRFFIGPTVIKQFHKNLFHSVSRIFVQIACSWTQNQSILKKEPAIPKIELRVFPEAAHQHALYKESYDFKAFTYPLFHYP